MRGQKSLIAQSVFHVVFAGERLGRVAVTRNIRRFPADFMFVLSDEELSKWRSQFVTSNADRMGLRHAPMAFTEQGAAMLSSVVNCKQAIDVTSRSCAPS